MSFGPPSRVFCSDLQNGSAWQFGVSVAKNRRCSRWKFTPQFEMRRRSLEILSCARGVGFQFRIFGKGADELRLFIRNAVDTYGRPSLREFSSRGRTSRPHCYVDSAFDDSMASITKWRVLKELPAETANSLYNKDASSRVIRECGDAADRLVSQAGTSFLAVRCDADSSDKGKEEILWTNKSVTTASGALAEWRSARTRSGQDIVDWGRYHLQVMFVDRSHRARSRLAEGLFERIAAWNGFGLILYGHSCGISAKEGELPSMSYQGEAQRLGVARHVFKAPATTLDRSDLDSYDLIVAMDIEVRDEVLRIAGSQPSNGNDYVNKVRLISEFVSYGTTSLLEDTLLELIQPDLTQALTALEVQATYMSQYSKWRMMIATITMCCAGLIQFLMDAYPDDLPDYDPID